MRRLLCFLLGHKLGAPTRVLGIELRRCSRCGRTDWAVRRL